MRKLSSTRRTTALLLTAAIVGALTVATASVADVVAPTVPAASAAPVPGGLGFTSLNTPCRAVDTRSGGGALGPDTTRSFQVGGTGSLAAQGGNAAGCGVPDGAGAVEIAITAVGPSGSGFLRMFAAGDAVPNATFVNYTSGVGITNTGTVPLAAAGTRDLSARNFGGTTHVVVDVLGYFTTSPTAENYLPLTPCRAVDTRLAGGPLTSGAGDTRGFQIGGPGSLAAQGGSSSGCGVPDSASAAVVSITAVGPSGNGFLRAGPNGFAPAATVVNYTDGVGITNTGAVRLGTILTQDVTIKNFGTSTHVVVDVVGYFDGPGIGSRYQTVTPCRAVDTRFAPGAKMAPDTTRLFQLAGERNAYASQGTTAVTGCGVPLRAAAVTVAVTAVSPDGTGFARVYPAGFDPTGTFVNFTAARSITNTGAVALTLGGLRDLAVKNFGAGSNFVVDVLGYFDASQGFAYARPAKGLSVGGGHACRTAAFGTVECWGDNSNGQLGSMQTGRNRGWPAAALGVYGASSVSSGSNHTCALGTGGAVRCWGENSAGQLSGTGATRRGTAAEVAGLPAAVALATGAEHSCALLADRTVRCWGDNAYGQLGDGSEIQRNTPVAVSGLSNVAAITAGGYSTCALLADGTARCWGQNSNGQLGDGAVTDRLVPTTVTGLSGAVSITSGTKHTCALLSTGSVRCWGRNSYGELGDGTTTGRRTPTAVVGLTGPVSISAGGGHTCAVLADRTARCWGFNDYGQLGDGTTVQRTTPVAVGVGTGIIAVSTGETSTCALAFGGETGCWGNNSSGLLGGGTSSIGSSIVQPTAASFGATAVAAGANHTCAATYPVATQCWGSNSNGQLGVGDLTNRNAPTTLITISGTVGISAGNLHTCALRFDGTVRCWGDNAFGQLGYGGTLDRDVPTPVFSLSGAVGITAGNFHSCALFTNGTVKCWGDNFYGQLGDGTTTQRIEPVTVPGITSAVAVTGGDFHTCAALLDGSARCWGTGAALGNGSFAAQLTPVAVTGLAGAFSIDAGLSHTCAVVATPTLFGALRCWGENFNGRLGDGTLTNRTTPVASSGLDNATVVSSGYAHTCALIENGAAPRCWGDNNFGQVGDGTFTQRSAPVAIGGVTEAVALATGEYHTCAIRGIGALSCWGRNQRGQLGDSTTTDRSTAVGVTGLS
jgi:alpha-tubulin suppressor-like RCC1 family protein